MRIRPFVPILFALSIAVFSAFPLSVRAEEPTSTPTATATLEPPRFFNVRLQTKPLDKPVSPLQDVQGKVTAKTGAGIDGVVVRAFSSDWQAFEATHDGGNFNFSLTSGSYTLQLVDMVAQELKLTVDGKTELRPEFYEVESLPPSPTSSTPSSTATETPTATPTGTETLSPTSTTNPLPTTIVAASTFEPAEPTPTSLPIPIISEINPQPLLQAFTYGAALGGGFVVLGLALYMVKRL